MKIQTLDLNRRIIFVQKTFQPKIFRLKTSETREFQTFTIQTTDSLCSDTFQPKIFALKLKHRS